MLLAALGLLLQDDPADLLKGVARVASPGYPGAVVAVAEDATPLLVSGDGRTVTAAAGGLERGRVVLFGHDGYLTVGAAKEGDTGRLLKAALVWAGRNGYPTIGVLTPGHADLVQGLGLTPLLIERGKFAATIRRANVLLLDDAPDPDALRDWLKGGGGLVAGATPWGWAQGHPGLSIARDLPLNRAVAGAGVLFADGGGEGVRPATPEERTARNAAVALASLDSAEGAADTVANAVRAVPPGSPFDAAVRRAVADLPPRDGPSDASPWGPKEGRDRLALVLRARDRAEGRRVPDVEPTAADFPGAVAKSVPRETATVEVDGARGGWQSTGRYAAPGETIEIRLPKDVAARGGRVRIGVHTDENWALAEWRRHPSIATSATIVGETTRVASPFGGLVSVEITGGPKERVTVANAVAAPRYVLGRTTPQEWARARRAPAPWAEFEGRYLILTVPRDLAAGVDDPAPLMALWDRTLELYSELDGSPVPKTPERIVADRQIAAGYMHSGYPIMTGLDAVPLSLSVDRLKTEGSWGHWHELGHNRQWPDWTFDGTGEVTVNLYTLWAMEKIAGKGLWDRLGKDGRPKKETYLQAGAPFERWKSDPFLALTMYAELIEAFGWEGLQKTLRSYIGLAEGDRPKTDAEKRDQWLVRYSRAVGRNLSPFFVAWGVPTSDEARTSLKDLPAWAG